MHSRIIELAKNKTTLPVKYNELPDFILDYVDYLAAVSPSDYEEDFKWIAKFTNGTNYIPEHSLMIFNPNEIVQQMHNDINGFWVYLVDGEKEYGLTHDDSLMTMHDFGEFLLSLYNDDNIFKCLSSIDYHF